MKPLFYVTKTYDETTPESAEIGDFSDSGFVFKNLEMNLEEVLNEITNHGVSHIEHFRNEIRIEGHEFIENYSDLTYRRETLFIKSREFNDRIISRLFKLLNKETLTKIRAI